MSSTSSGPASSYCPRTSVITVDSAASPSSTSSTTTSPRPQRPSPVAHVPRTATTSAITPSRYTPLAHTSTAVVVPSSGGARRPDAPHTAPPAATAAPQARTVALFMPFSSPPTACRWGGHSVAPPPRPGRRPRS
jgi:hypothetical protein